MNLGGHNPGLPIEQFIQALTSQLDRAQAALRLKAVGLPLTFAVKDLTLDLRAQMEMIGSVVHIRPAGPSETEASTIRLQLTTITRPMIEENAAQFADTGDEPSLREVLGPDVSEDDQRRLEWAGIHNVAQLREVQRRSGADELEKYTQVPALRLRAALARAELPHISRVALEPSRAPADRGTAPTLKIRGINLHRALAPRVTIRGESVPVLHASEKEIHIAPRAQLMSGTLSIEVEPGVVTEMELNFPEPAAPAVVPGALP